MEFGLFHHCDPLYVGGKLPWDPEYSGGKLLEKEAYEENFREIDAVEEIGWDYLWLAGAHFASYACMDPQVFVLAAAIAGRTRKIKIGSSIHRPALRGPGEKAA